MIHFPWSYSFSLKLKFHPTDCCWLQRGGRQCLKGANHCSCLYSFLAPHGNTETSRFSIKTEMSFQMGLLGGIGQILKFIFSFNGPKNSEVGGSPLWITPKGYGSTFKIQLLNLSIIHTILCAFLKFFCKHIDLIFFSNFSTPLKLLRFQLPFMQSLTYFD